MRRVRLQSTRRDKVEEEGHRGDDHACEERHVQRSPEEQLADVGLFNPDRSERSLSCHAVSGRLRENEVKD